MSRTQSFLVAVAVGIVAIASGLLLAHALLNRGEPPATVKATVLTPPRPLPQFSLVDHTGAAFDTSRLKGHWSLLFFGFTRCPDVCPATLGIMAQAERLLVDLPAEQRPHVVLVSVDPQRDTPEQLASYVRFFSPSFVGVTGTQPAIDDLTRALGVPVARVASPNGNGDYTVDHSAAIFVIDPQGALRALFSTPHVPATIADDYRRLAAAG